MIPVYAVFSLTEKFHQSPAPQV